MKKVNCITTFLGAGVALEILALILGSVASDSFILGFLILAGISVGLLGVSKALAGNDQQDGKPASPLFISFIAMAVVFFLASQAIPASWDSIGMFCKVFAIVSLGVGILVILPSIIRKAALTFLLLFHFLGIITAVTSLDPPNAPASWIATTLWATVFRHYLNFCYLNNAYHFYSPEPGPPSLVWARIQYKDGTFRWIKIPNRKESPTQMHYQRMLSVTESTNQNQTNSPENWEELLQRRNLAGLAHMPQITPLSRQMAQMAMYREPSEYSKRMVSSYTRFLSLQFPHPEGKNEIGIDRIKIYRITHNIISVQDLARGESPLDNTLFLPYYLGEFNTAGELINPTDPFLYFLLPITRTLDPGKPTVTVNCLEIHSGEVKEDPQIRMGEKK